MRSRPLREFVYRYNGDPYSQQVTQDRSGMMPMHLAGEIVHRNGKEWKVAVVQNEYPPLRSADKVVQRVFLTDNF
jgi:hypothetical protein